MSAAISERLRAFLQERLSSMDQIEVVLLLMHEPDRAWTAPEVASALGTPPQSAAMRLFLLASSGVILFEAGSGVPRYRFMATADEQEALLRELAGVYASDRGAILDVVEPGPRDPLRSFSDAFKLKK